MSTAESFADMMAGSQTSGGTSRTGMTGRQMHEPHYPASAKVWIVDGGRITSTAQFGVILSTARNQKIHTVVTLLVREAGKPDRLVHVGANIGAWAKGPSQCEAAKHLEVLHPDCATPTGFKLKQVANKIKSRPDRLLTILTLADAYKAWPMLAPKPKATITVDPKANVPATAEQLAALASK